MASAAGMANQTRMILCVFMLGVLAFNPFSAVFGRLGSDFRAFDYDTSHGGRMLHSLDAGGTN